MKLEDYPLTAPGIAIKKAIRTTRGLDLLTKRWTYRIAATRSTPNSLFPTAHATITSIMGAADLLDCTWTGVGFQNARSTVQSTVRSKTYRLVLGSTKACTIIVQNEWPRSTRSLFFGLMIGRMASVFHEDCLEHPELEASCGCIRSLGTQLYNF